MKVAESKTTATPAKSNSPFFQKGAHHGLVSTADSVQPFFQKKSNDITAVQAKLTIGQPNDKYEQEADATADKVVQRLSNNNSVLENNPSNNIQTKPVVSPASITPFVQTKCTSCEQEEKLQKKEMEEDSDLRKVQKKPIFESNAEPPADDEKNVQRKCATCEHEDEKKVQAKSDDPADSAETSPIESSLSSSKGSGSPLPAATRREMESSFGADFSNVKIHNNSAAAEMSEGINAQAFTHGSDIYFNSGKYDIGSSEGKHLLAHELTHTVQQGASHQHKQENSRSGTNQVQRFSLTGGIEWIKSQIKDGLNSAAEAIIPGYSLLNTILGKNLITDVPVERSGKNLVKGYMQLVPGIGTILLNELKETETLTQAATWTEAQVAKFGIDFNDIARRLAIMWDKMSVLEGLDYNVNIFKIYIGPVLGKFLAFSSVMQQKMKELRLEGALRLVGATELLAALKKDPAAFKRVLNDPSLILSNFMEALKQGFSAFKDNFATHFKNALFGWLLGKAASMGVQMPKEFSIAGIFHLVAQLAGLTYNSIKALVIERLGLKYGKMAAKVFEAIEKAVEVIQRVVTEGPIALWEMVKEQLTNLKDMVISQVTELVTSEIIKSAVTKLLSMLNPAGALVQLVLTLYRVIKFFIDNWATIKEIVTGIINTVTQVALGQLGGAAGFIENILAKGMQLIISFLARIFGLDGIADKVKELLNKFGGLIIKARDWVINWLVEKGKALYDSLLGKDDKKEDKGKGGLAAVEQEIENEGKEKKKDGELSKQDADKIVSDVKRDQSDVISSISVRDGGETWDFEYVQRTTLKVLKSANKWPELKLSDVNLRIPQTVLVASVNGNILAEKFRSRDGIHAEQKFNTFIRDNEKQLFTRNSQNHINVNITRSPCESCTNGVLIPMMEHYKNEPYFLSLEVAAMSDYQGKRKFDRNVDLVKLLLEAGIKVTVFNFVEKMKEFGVEEEEITPEAKIYLEKRISQFQSVISSS